MRESMASVPPSEELAGAVLHKSTPVLEFSSVMKPRPNQLHLPPRERASAPADSESALPVIKQIERKTMIDKNTQKKSQAPRIVGRLLLVILAFGGIGAAAGAGMTSLTPPSRGAPLAAAQIAAPPAPPREEAIPLAPPKVEPIEWVGPPPREPARPAPMLPPPPKPETVAPPPAPSHLAVHRPLPVHRPAPVKPAPRPHPQKVWQYHHKPAPARGKR